METNKYSLMLNKDRIPFLLKESVYDGQLCATSGETVVRNMNYYEALEQKAEEYLFLLCIDAKGKVIGIFEISHGTATEAPVSPREIMIRALLCGAVNIIIVHNHPAGNTSPSKEDIAVTKRIQDAGKFIRIPLLDHLIIGRDGEFYSFYEEGFLN